MLARVRFPAAAATAQQFLVGCADFIAGPVVGAGWAFYLLPDGRLRAVYGTGVAEVFALFWPSLYGLQDADALYTMRVGPGEDPGTSDLSLFLNGRLVASALAGDDFSPAVAGEFGIGGVVDAAWTGTGVGARKNSISGVAFTTSIAQTQDQIADYFQACQDAEDLVDGGFDYLWSARRQLRTATPTWPASQGVGALDLRNNNNALPQVRAVQANWHNFQS
jgi:hypothetical protein